MTRLGKINFFSQDIDFKLKGKRKLKAWIRNVANIEGASIQSVNFIFTSDQTLYELNKKYLNRNYFTDILTFDLSEKKPLIHGDIFISIDRIKENAVTFKSPFRWELSRVMIHGILHLIGYHDKTSTQKRAMRKKEEACLSLQDI